jgi:hypothetical protein
MSARSRRIFIGKEKAINVSIEGQVLYKRLMNIAILPDNNTVELIENQRFTKEVLLGVTGMIIIEFKIMFFKVQLEKEICTIAV